MTANRRLLVAFSFLIVALVPVLAGAATIEFRTLIDVDNDGATGCSAAGMTGVEHVVVTVVKTDATSGAVEQSYRLACSGGSLGSPIDMNTTGWPVGFNAASGGMLVENRIAFATLGAGMPSGLRLGFDARTGSSTHSATATSTGASIIYPEPRGRRRSVAAPGGDSRFFELDGSGVDWGAIDPVVNGIAGDGTPAIRMIKAFAYANATDEFVYFRVDANGGGDAPFAEDDEYSRTVGQASLAVAAPGVLANDGDPNGQPITALPVSPAAHGDVTLNPDGSFTYSPADPASSQTDSFQYKATNGAQESNVAKVTINVSSVANLAPVAVNDSRNATEDQTLNVPAPGVLDNDSDADGDTLTATKLTDPSNGSVVVNPDGSFTYTPDLDFFGTDTFTYEVSDGEFTSTATVTITVESVNDAPTVSPDAFSVDENAANGTAVGIVNMNDVDAGDSHGFAITGGNTGGVFAISNSGQITVLNNAALDFESVPSYSLTVTVTDNGIPSQSGSATITITVNDQNEVPVAVNDNAAINEDGNVNVVAPGLLANDTDPEGDTLTATKLTDPANGTATVAANGAWTYQPNANFNGTDSFTYQVSDGTNTSNIATVTITVTAVNDAPSFTAGPAVSSLEDTSHSAAWATAISAGPANESTQALSFIIVSNDNSALFSVQPSISPAGVLSYTPTPNATGSANLTVRISDDGGTANGGIDTSATQPLTITITSVNDMPSFTKGSDVTVLENAGAQSFNPWATALSDNDAEAVQNLSFIVQSVADPSLFSVQPTVSSTGVLSFTPMPGTDGVTTVTLVIMDDGGTANGGVDTSGPQTFTVNVHKIPAITSANTTTFLVGTLGSFTVTTTGRPKADIAIGGVALPAGVTFVDNGDGTGTLSGSPGPGTGGVYNITFTASNVHGSSPTQNFTLNIHQPPTITSANAVTFTTGQLGSFTVTTTGFPAPSIALGGVALPSGVSFVDNGNGTATLSGIPDPGTGGTYAITFTASNAAGTTPAQNFTLTVNQAPAITSADNVTFTAGQSGTFTVTTTGFPAAAIARGGVALPTGISFVDNNNGTGTLSGIAGPGTGGTYAITFTATNVAGSSPTQNFTLTINEAPIVTGQPSAQITCAGGNATFTATASGVPAPTVQWQVDSGSGFADIPGATSTTLNFPTAAGDDGNLYRAVFTNVAGTAASNAVSLRVDTLPTVDTDPLPQTVCAGGTATFTAAASSNAGQTVQWQVDTGSGFTDIPGATSLTLSFTTTTGDTANQYRAVFTNACGSVNSSAATLVVDTLPVVTQDPVDASTCDGGAVSLTAAATSNASDHTVQWQVDSGSGFTDIPGATSTTLNFNAAPADNGNQYRAVFTTACGSVNTAAATLTVNTNPVVTTHPLSQTACAGANATFIVATSGPLAPTVQWQVDSGSGFTDIPGATSTTLSFATAAGDNGNQYRAVFTNSCGSTNTNAATLTVDTLPVVTTNPLTQTVCAGGTATFTAAATSNASNHTVQWQVDSGSGFTDIPGATTTTLAFTTATGDNGKQYRAVFTTSCGAVNTTAATLTVDTLPVVTTDPLTQTVCAGGTATFTVAATSNASNHTVQWQVDSGSGFTDIPGATTTTLAFATAAGDNGNQYRAVFTTSCGSTNTAAATLTVDTLPVITTDPVTQTYCAGATATFTAAATSNAGNHTVQWQVDSGSGFTNIPGETSTTLSFTAATGDNGKQYRAVFTTSCGSTNTAAATLTIDSLPVVTTDPLTQTVCAGGNASFTAAATSNASNHTVQWQVDSGSGFTDMPGETATTLTFAAAAGDNGKQYRAVFTTSCGSTNTAAATLTVDTTPVVTTDPVTQTYCAGATATFTAAATSNASNHTVQWQVDSGSGFTDIPGATTTTLAFTAAAGDNGKQYRAVFTTSCGSTNTSAATLTVDTLPVITTDPVTQAVCDSAAVNFTAAATSNASNHTVQWQVDSGSGFTDIPGATTTTLAFTAVPADDGNQYRAVFTTSCGSTNTAAATLTVNTSPAVTTQPVDQTVCENTLTTFTAAASGSPAPTVQWQVSTDGGANFNDLPGETSTTLSFTATAADNTKKYRAVFTNTCAAVNSSAATLTVNTVPVVTTAPASQSVQSGSPVTFTTAASGTPAPTVKWQVSTDAGANFTDMPGETNTTLSFTAQISQNGNQYRSVFTNSCGTATSAAATLTVTCPTITVTRTGGGSFPNGTYNVAYTGQSFTATGGTAPYTFTLVTAPATFPTGLTLNPDGTITGTPTATGVFTFDVKATDAGNCEGSQTFTINIAPDAQPDSYGVTAGTEAVGNTQVVVDGHSAPTTPFVAYSGSILANDQPAGATVTAVTDAATTLGGTITIDTAGKFTYNPPVGAVGSDTYTYTLNSNGVTATGVITIKTQDVLWYINNTYAGANGASNGQSHRPFTASPAAAAAAQASQTIFVHTGSGNTTGAFAMKAGQTLHGNNDAFTLRGLSISAGTKPTLDSTVTLASSVTVRGLAISVASGSGIAGSTALGTSTVSNVAMSGVGGIALTTGASGSLTVTNSSTLNISGSQNAVRVSGTTASLTLDSSVTVTGNGGTAVLLENNTAGTVTFSAVCNCTGQTASQYAIRISGNSGTWALSWPGVISAAANSGSGALGSLRINNNTNTGGIAFSGNPKAFVGGGSANGVELDTNTGVGITFTNGGLQIGVVTGVPFSAIGGGTVTISGANNTLTTTGGTSAFNMANTSIHNPNGITFQSVNQNGGTNGIVLNNTGTGPFTVTGTGGAGSGGTIQNTTGAGLSMTTTTAVSLTNVNFSTCVPCISGTGFGTLTVSGVSVTGANGLLSLNNGTVNGTFSNVSGAVNANVAAVSLTAVGGTFTVTGGTITKGGSANTVMAVSAGNATITWNGPLTQNTNAALLDVSGGHTGSITFGGNLSATAGTGLQFSNADGTYNFNGTTTTMNGGDAGVDILAGSSGTFSFTSGTSITGPTGVAFRVNGSAPTEIGYAGTITHNAGRAVEIGHTASNAACVTAGAGNDINFTGNITSNGAGASGILIDRCSSGAINFSGTSKTLGTQGNTAVTITNNGATVNFSNGGLVITRTTGGGITASGGGTLIVTKNAGASNTIGSGTSAAALNISGVTIGTGGLVFESIAQSGGANAIVLANTGSTAGLTVAGTGAANSGGTIQNTTSHGISLTNTLSPSFNNVRIQTTGGAGVDGTGVTNFTFTNGTITGSGDAVYESNIAFNDDAAGTENNVSGIVTITNNTLSTAFDGGIDIRNGSGTISDAQITGNTISSTTATATSKGSGIRLDLRGTNSTVGSLTKATIDSNNVSNFPSGSGILVQGSATAAGPSTTIGDPASGTNVVNITNNLVAGNSVAIRMGSNAIVTAVNGKGQGNINISTNGTVANPLTNVAGVGVALSAFGNVTVKGVINNNRIVANNTVNSPGISAGADSTFGTSDTPNLTLTITNNNVSGMQGNGILSGAKGCNATANITITGNTVGTPTAGARPGIRLDSNVAAIGGNTNVCLDIQNNTTSGSGGAPGIGIRKEGTNAAVNVFGIEGLSPSPNNPNGTEDDLGTLNPGSAFGSAGFSNDGLRTVRAIVLAGDNFVSCSSAP